MHDFGGDGPVVHVAHANGFPPGTYRLLAGVLADRYHLVGLPTRPLWPGSQPSSAPTWRPLAADLVCGLDRLGLSGIVGLGHSLGGVLSLWAALSRPDLFRALVLIEPVILPPSWLRALGLLRCLGLSKYQPLVRGALHRRRVWPSNQACYEHYRARPLFARWSDDSLWAYIESGTRLGSGGKVELVYPTEWEAHIFATTPLDVWSDIPRLSVPVLVIRGEHSKTFGPAAQRRMARLLPAASFVTIPDAGHLVPMERPVETASAAREFIRRQSP
jgi:pimeloyl-ACP methyl ester carboxylesterase